MVPRILLTARPTPRGCTQGCIARYRFCDGRIGEIRPLILSNLGGGILEGFCDSQDVLVDVVQDAALVLQFPVQRPVGNRALLKLIAEFFIGLLEALAMASKVSAEFAGD